MPGSKASINDVEQAWNGSRRRERRPSTAKSPFLHDDGSIAGLVGVTIGIAAQTVAEARRARAVERQRDDPVREVHRSDQESSAGRDRAPA